MISALLIVKEPGDKSPQGKGEHKFLTLPRIGEYVELEIDGKAQLYRVYSVVHNGVRSGIDVFAAYEGLSGQVHRRLFDEASVPERITPWGE